MKPVNYSLLFIFALSASTAANAAGSMLRITCEGDDVGAEVLINGKFKGECPMDVQVPAGTSKLQVQKKINNEDRLFEQEIRMGDGGVKKIEVKLLSKAFFLNIKKAEAGDIRAMRIVALTYKQNLVNGKGDAKYNKEQDFIWTHKLAEAGQAREMISLGEDYQLGWGVEQNTDEANRWYRQGLELIRKAAENGEASAMIDLGCAYAHGTGVAKDREKAITWFNRAKDKGKDIDDYLDLYQLR